MVSRGDPNRQNKGELLGLWLHTRIMNIGDKIIECYNDRTKELTVIKIGRRWATLSNDVQIDKDTLQKNGESYGHFYFTEVGLAEHTARNRLRKLLYKAPSLISTMPMFRVVELIAILEEVGS